MTTPKQLPQRFAVMIKPEIALMPYVIDVEIQINNSIFDPTDKLVRITGNVVAGPSSASTGASTDERVG